MSNKFKLSEQVEQLSLDSSEKEIWQGFKLATANDSRNSDFKNLEIQRVGLLWQIKKLKEQAETNRNLVYATWTLAGITLIMAAVTIFTNFKNSPPVVIPDLIGDPEIIASDSVL